MELPDVGVDENGKVRGEVAVGVAGDQEVAIGGRLVAKLAGAGEGVLADEAGTLGCLDADRSASIGRRSILSCWARQKSRIVS